VSRPVARGGAAGAPLVYQINTRCWLRELAARVGRRVHLGQVPAAEFERWRELGFTHIWLLGVWTTGPRARRQALESADLRQEYDKALPGWTEEDVGGSPYAIADYQVSRELGGDAALRKFRKQLHEHGLKLILDFVPNHLGLDHPWVTNQPELFVQADKADAGSLVGGSAGTPLRLCHGRDPFFEPWTDTVQLDHRRADTRALLVLELTQLAQVCDGLRCDMAMLLLNEVFDETWRAHPCRGERAAGEFWEEAIAAVRSRWPEFLFLAEAYWNRERDLLKLGFDFAYHKPVMDALFDQPDAAQSVILQAADWLEQGAHFLENHDERRVAESLAPEANAAAALVILGLPGLRLLHEGQLEGWKVRTPVQLVRRQFEETESTVRASYDRLLKVLEETSIGRGVGAVLAAHRAWEENTSSHWFVLVQWQAAADEFFLVAVNLAPHRSQCYVPLTVPAIATHDWRLKDLLGEEAYERSGEELQARGLYLDVPAYATQLFHFAPIPREAGNRTNLLAIRLNFGLVQT
jgi:hypothetical protein